MTFGCHFFCVSAQFIRHLFVIEDVMKKIIAVVAVMFFLSEAHALTRVDGSYGGYSGTCSGGDSVSSCLGAVGARNNWAWDYAGQGRYTLYPKPDNTLDLYLNNVFLGNYQTTIVQGSFYESHYIGMSKTEVTLSFLLNVNGGLYIRFSYEELPFQNYPRRVWTTCYAGNCTQIKE